ncbi:ABC transporter permease [candidate division KSB1 bacterium]
MKENKRTALKVASWIISRLKLYEKNFALNEGIKEEYDERSRAYGKFSVLLWLWSQILAVIIQYFIFSLYRGTIMFKNYLKTGYRNFKRQKLVSAINVTGLSLGLACSILITLFIADELSFDRFHDKADQIYSVINRDNYFNYTYRLVPNGVGSTLTEFYDEIEYSVRISPVQAVVRCNEKIFREECTLIDPEFFQIFSFRLLIGDPENALASDNSAVLTESSAQKYFGNEDPIGKELEFQAGQWTKLFQVTGIIEDAPDNSSIEYGILLNISNLVYVRGENALTTMTWPRCHTFVLLDDDLHKKRIEERMPAYVKQYCVEYEAQRRQTGQWNETGETIEFFLQNIKDIHLHTNGIPGEADNAIIKSYILAAIGLLVVIIAGINFTNLAVGRAATRATEVGIRKIFGADRKNLIKQFWAESVIIIIISAMLSLILAVLIMPLFNELANKNLYFGDFITGQNLLIFLLLIAGLGFAAGSYPGLVLSGFQPVMIFRKRLHIGGRNALTKTLVVLQFSISIFLVIATLTMGKQLKYIDHADLGYKKDNILVIETQEREFKEGERVIKYFRNRTEGDAKVISVSGCVFSLGTNQGEGRLIINGISRRFNFSHVYHGYFETMGMEFIEGRGFSERLPEDFNEVVVNQEFVKQYNLKDPVGMTAADNTKVVGVVKDFNYGSLKDEIIPVIHWINPQGSLFTLLVKITDDNIGDTISGMENIWKDIQPDKPFVYSFLQDNLDRFYAEDKKWNSIVLYSSVFALVITCLGLVGITTVTVSRRIKEIGIKKVLGASVLNIINLLSKEFLFLVFVSNIIVWPVGYYIMDKWLQSFAYRTGIDIRMFIFAGLLSVFLTIVTISFQTVRATRLNPVDTLRHE